MKLKLILLSLIFVTVNLAISQDLLDPPKIQGLYTTTVIDRNTNYFMGWNWGNQGKKLDTSLLMNSYHNYPIGSFDVKSFMKVMEVPGDGTKITVPNNTWGNGLIGGRNSNNAWLGQSLHLEPTLTVDSTDNFVPRAGDKTNAVFGFEYRNTTIGSILNDSSLTNFSRYLLDQTGVTTPIRVLDNIWNGSILTWLNYKPNIKSIDSTVNPHIITYDSAGTNHSDLNIPYDRVTFHPFNGKQFYLSINLRSLDSVQLDSHLNDTLLALRIQYDLYDSTTNSFTYPYVKFDSIPQNSVDSSSRLSINSTLNNQFRGFARRLNPSPSQPTTIYITGRMLRLYNINPDNNNITISAFANFDGDIDQFTGLYINNPLFRNDYYTKFYANPEYITKVDVEVEYYGKVNLGIDWIRLETPRAQAIMRGQRDLLLSQEVNKTINKYNPHIRKPKIHRFYASDELTPQQWQVNRYFNMMCDTIGSSETFTYHDRNKMFPKHYLINTAFKEFWNGSTIVYRNNSPAPFIKLGAVGDSLSKRMKLQNYKYGYSGYDHTSYNPPQKNSFNDSLKSEYETKFWFYGNGWTDSLDEVEDSLYTHNFVKPVDVWEKIWDLNSNKCILMQSQLMEQEFTLYHGYFKQKYLLYGGKPFWSNIWATDVYSYNPDYNAYFLPHGNNRPKTGEEFRNTLNSTLILGSKGIFYWIKSKEAFKKYSFANSNEVTLGIQNNDEYYFQFGLQTGENLLYSESIGGDYINKNDNANSTYNWASKYDSTKYDWNRMGVPVDSLYIGLRSMRAEMYKVHSFLKANEQELLNLDLQAWYGKGFTKLYTQGYQYNHNDTIIKNFVKYDNIRTRKLFQPDSLGGYNSNQVNEHKDSSFVDVTIFKNKNISLDTVFYIGIQNRRTDPLVWLDVEEPTNKWNLLFVPSARFDQLIRFGADSTKWQNLWWKRLGAREITLPLINTMKNQSFDGTYYEVAELGADNDTLNANFWRQPKYYDLVDTIIRNNDTLKIRFLPGEGKIIKTEPKKMFTSDDDNDSTECESCDTFTKNIKITRSAQSGTNPKCFSINIENNSDCDYGEMNIVLKINGITNANITSSLSVNSQVVGSEQVVSIKGSINNNSTKSLTFCFPADSPNFNYQLFAGRYVKGQFVFCDKPLSEYEYVDTCKDCSTIIANVIDKNDSCECACDYRIQGNIGIQSGTCPLTSWGYDLIENGDTTSITGLSFTGGIMFGEDICLGDGDYKLKINFYRNGKIVCSKYAEKECNLCDSITVQIQRLIEENGAIYAPGSVRITIKLRNLDNCITNIGGNLITPRPTGGVDSLSINANILDGIYTIGQSTRTIHFINAEGDTICSKSFTFGSPIYHENMSPYGIVENMNDLGGLCCSEVKVKELVTNNIDIYAVMIYDPITMIPYHNEARNPNTASPYDFSGAGHYFTDVCSPSDSVLRYDILLYSGDTILVAHLSFDSLCTSYNRRSSNNIESMSLYPNPTVDKVTLDYELKEDAEVEIELLDHKGSIISTDKLKTKKKGKHSYEFDFIDNQVSIMYILLRSNNEEKILKQLIYK